MASRHACVLSGFRFNYHCHGALPCSIFVRCPAQKYLQRTFLGYGFTDMVVFRMFRRWHNNSISYTNCLFFFQHDDNPQSVLVLRKCIVWIQTTGIDRWVLRLAAIVGKVCRRVATWGVNSPIIHICPKGKCIHIGLSRFSHALIQIHLV